MSEPDYKNDLYFEQPTLKGNIDKIISNIESIKKLVKDLPTGQIRVDLAESVVNNLTSFETKVRVWKEILK